MISENVGKRMVPERDPETEVKNVERAYQLLTDTVAECESGTALHDALRKVSEHEKDHGGIVHLQQTIETELKFKFNYKDEKSPTWAFVRDNQELQPLVKLVESQLRSEYSYWLHKAGKPQAPLRNLDQLLAYVDSFKKPTENDSKGSENKDQGAESNEPTENDSGANWGDYNTARSAYRPPGRAPSY